MQSAIRALAVAVPVLGAAVAALRPIRDSSFLWHVRAGSDQLAAGEVLRSDPYSLTRSGEEWRTQSWLLELVYGLFERAWPDLLWVGWFRFVVAALTIGLVMAVVHRVTRNQYVTGFFGALVVWIGLPYFTPRPVIVSFALIAALLVVVSDRRGGWLIPVLLWFWASIHGSFVLGIGYLVLEALRSRRRDLAGWAALGVVVSALTAHGLAIWVVLARFVASRDALGFISEWARPDLLDIDVLPFAVALGLLVAGFATRRLGPHDLWIVVPFVIFGLSSLRAVFPAFLVLLPVAAAGAPRPAPPSGVEERGPASPPSAVAAVAVAAAIAVVAVVIHRPGLDAGRFPLGLAIPDGNVLHDDRVGGYLIYMGRNDVFVDDRAELYGADFYRELVAIFDGDDITLEHLADRYAVTGAVMRQDRLEAFGEWHVVDVDGDFVLLRGP